MTKFLNISTDDTLGGSSPSDDVVSSQKAIKSCIDNSTSGFLKNTATGTNSLTIIGTASSASKATNIGASSVASGDWATSIGYKCQAKAPNSVSLGYNCIISSTSNKSIAIGSDANVTNANAYQIGPGTNSTYKSLSVGFYDSNNPVNYLLLKSDGTIPVDRYINFTGADGTNAGEKGVVPAPTATDNTKFLRGDGSWEEPVHIWISEEQTVPTSANLYVNHGLTLTDPMKATAYLYMKFVNAVAGYSVGDITPQLPTHTYYAPGGNTTATAPVSNLLELTSTSVVFPRIPSSSMRLYDKTTGAFAVVAPSDVKFIAKIVY